MVDRWLESEQRTERKHSKRVYYLSIEFLIGRLLFDTLINLRLLGTARTALASLDVDLDQLRKLEPDAALGNGGLGRLAACYMDSMAALAVPAYGYGIRYEHGLFMQQIRDGWQKELPERWLAFGNPWEFERLETEYSIRFGGSVEYIGGGVDGTARGLWYPAERVLAVAHDTPITGWRGRHVNTLRLWSARSTTPVQLGAFNEGDVARRDRPADAGRSDFEGALSERRHARRTGVAAAAGVFLHVGVAAGHRAASSAAFRQSEVAARAGRHSAQRHASGDRCRRADANPGR